jgi:hypothetical protein
MMPSTWNTASASSAADRGTLQVETNLVSGTVELSSLKDQTVAFDGGGLSRKPSIYRLPEADWRCMRQPRSFDRLQRRRIFA